MTETRDRATLICWALHHPLTRVVLTVEVHSPWTSRHRPNMKRQDLNPQLSPQLKFLLIHLAIVGFVIVTAQMKNAVEDQLLYLVFEG